MAAEFEAEVKNTLRSIQAQVDSLAKSQGKLGDSMRKYGEEARNAFRNAGTREHAQHIESAGKAMHELGHAVRFLGGPLGEIAHKLTGGAGMVGGFGAIAVAAGAASLAFEAFNANVERHVEEVKKSIEAEDEWRRMIEQGEEAALKQAEAGLKQADARRKLLAAGGQEAVSAAASAKKAIPFAQGEDVEGGVAAIYARYGSGARAKATIEQAQALTLTGLTFSEAARAMIAAGGAVEQPGVGRAVAARVYASRSGRIGNPDEIFSTALANLGGDPLLNAASEAGGVRNNVRDDEAKKAIKDGARAARDEAGKQKDDVQERILAKHHEQVHKLDELAHLFRAAGSTTWGLWGQALKDFEYSRFGIGEGSYLNQYRRLQVEMGQEALTHQRGQPLAPGE